MPLAVPAFANVAAAAAGAAARAAEVLRDPSYQTSLPPPVEQGQLELPLGPLALVFRVLLLAGLAVLAVLAATWLARRLGLAGARDVEASGPGPEAPPDPAHLPVEGAEALASEGRFAEAIHALLLDTLEALSRAARLAPSLTSREIVARVPLAPRARDALAGLVDAVEVTWFGGAVPSEAEYLRCLDRFHAFRETYRSAA